MTDIDTVILDKLDSLQRSIDIKDKDFDEVIESIQNLTIRQGAVEAHLDEVRKIISSLPQKTQDKISEVTTPIFDEAQNLSKVIKGKKMIAVDNLETKKQIKPWYKFKFWG